jgi:hypothetical protein
MAFVALVVGAVSKTSKSLGLANTRVTDVGINGLHGYRAGRIGSGGHRYHRFRIEGTQHHVLNARFTQRLQKK